MIIILLIFLPVICFSQSTFTVTTAKLSPPTTMQVLLDKAVNHVITDSGKITAISLLLTDNLYYKSLCGVDIDNATGQNLTNYKYCLEEDIRNRKLGRNYSAGKTFPVFKKGK